MKGRTDRQDRKGVKRYLSPKNAVQAGRLVDITFRLRRRRGAWENKPHTKAGRNDPYRRLHISYR
jgi:hypothetical protein